MDRSLIYIILLINLLASINFYLKKRCEIPFFIAFFNIMVEYRLFALRNGYADWVDIDYGISFVLNIEQGTLVSNLIVLGSTVMLYSFIAFYRPSPNIIPDSDRSLKKFIQEKRTLIIIGLILFSIIQVSLPSGISVGYGFLTKLGISSFIILVFLVAVFTDGKNYRTKLVYFALLAVLGKMTYSEALRFQFLSWIIPLGFYLTRNIIPSKKIVYFFVGLFFIMVVFSSAGVLRDNYIKDMTLSQFYNKSIDRLLAAEDINFVDGFIMLHQIYPKRLDHTYGLEHLSILLRPIPRTIWPDKPLAGWVQNYVAKYKTENINVGFSPTLYGIFYAEAGIVGIVFFSILWGKFLSYLYASFKVFISSLWAILIGVLLTSLIPVFRSGDLAGDFSIVLMSYWPLIIFVNQYKKFLKKQSISNEV